MIDTQPLRFDTNEKKILTIDPSGERGTTGACLINTSTQQVEFFEHKGVTTRDQIEWLVKLVKVHKPPIIVYENTTYMNPADRMRVMSLFQVIGAIIAFKHCFDFVKEVDYVAVRSVKAIGDSVFRKEQLLSRISYEQGRGKGWLFDKTKRVSSHQLDAWIIYNLWIGAVRCKT